MRAPRCRPRSTSTGSSTSSSGCAGAIIDGTLAADDDTYLQFMSLFLHQKFWLARAALPGMAERGWGRLITTTSHGATGLLGQPIFAAAMGGVISMTRAIAFEYEAPASPPTACRRVARPGCTRSTRPMFEQLRADGLITEAEWESYVNTPPPEYVAPIVAWLCTDAADGVTGQVFHASGGAIGVWNRYEVERTIYRGDHRTNPPWTPRGARRPRPQGAAGPTLNRAAWLSTISAIMAGERADGVEGAHEHQGRGSAGVLPFAPRIRPPAGRRVPRRVP